MCAFFRKDLLVFWRDRKEVLISVLSPIVIIIVLNFAFADLWFGDTDEEMKIDVGLVIEDDESIGLKQFEESVKAMEISETEKEVMIEQAALLSPSGHLRSFFNDPEINSLIHTERLDVKVAKKRVKDGDLDALVKIPDGFTYDVLGQMLFNEPSKSSLVIQTEEQSIESSTLQSILDGYIDTLNFQFALSNVTGGETIDSILPRGEKEIIEGIETISITQYFTIAMGVLFTLFIASTVATKTTTEKRERVFNRILLADSHPFYYLMGKVLSTFILAWFQLMIVLMVPQLLLDVFPGKSTEFWLGAFLIITFFALTVAGLSALFTSLTLRVSNTDAANGLFMLIIMLFAALGGSFFPLEVFPDWIQRVSEWIPNGVTVTSILYWLQYGDASSLFVPIIKLLGFFVGFLIIGMGLFPRRGRI
jgi:ABC-2 type transport system permease protein